MNQETVMENEEPTSNRQGPAEAIHDFAAPPQAGSQEDMTLLLEDARSKADEHWNQFLKAKADMENLRRRHERDVESAHKYALERFATALLPVVDSLELGLEASKTTAVHESDDVKKLREGMELTLKMLQAALEKFGIKELNPKGEKFNPQLHQAMLTQESAEVEPNTVLTVCQKAYLLHDRLIRPAMVIVSKAPDAAA